MSVTIQDGPNNLGSYYNGEELYVELESDRFSGASAPFTPDEENLQAYIELWNKTADPDELIVALHAPYDLNTKRTDFDIGKFAPVRLTLPTASSITGAPLISGSADDSVLLLYFKYGDKFGNPPVPETLSTSDDFYVIHGSRSADNARSSELIQSGGVPFLLMHNNGDLGGAISIPKIVSWDQPDWLYFYTLSGFTMDVDVLLQFEDGSTNLVDVDEFLVSGKTMYWIQAGLPQLNIDAAGLYAYTIILQKAGDPGQRTIMYQIDRTCQDWGLTLLYDNGLGALETVHLKGKASHHYEVTGERFKSMRWKGFNVKDGEYETTGTDGSRVLTANTGYYPRHQVRMLQQLLHSRVWLINGVAFEKWVITSSRVLSAEDDADLFSLEIDLRPGWDDDNFTRQVNVFL